MPRAENAGPLVALLVCFAVTATLEAQMKPCDPGPTPAGYAVFLDEVRLYDPATATAPDRSLANSLLTSLRNHIDALALEAHPPLQRVDCRGRLPQPADFVQQPVEWMNNRRVVVELWALVREADATHRQAAFNIAIIPARLLELTAAEPPAIFEIQHTLSDQATQRDLAAVFQHHREISGYLFVGAGLRAMREQKYDYATAYLCRGTVDLRQSPQTAANQRLLRYATTAMQSTVTKAKGDKNYAGALKLLNRPEDACR